jgi:hypothetical protein
VVDVGEAAHRFGAEVGGGHRRRHQLQSPRLHAADVQDALHQTGQAAGLVADDLQLAALAGIRRLTDEQLH